VQLEHFISFTASLSHTEDKLTGAAKIRSHQSHVSPALTWSILTVSIRSLFRKFSSC